MTIINLTPHEVTIYDLTGSTVPVPRLLEKSSDAVPVVKTEFGDGSERVLAAWRWTGTAWEPAP